jgi:carbohydrate-selective porin OprB
VAGGSRLVGRIRLASPSAPSDLFGVGVGSTYPASPLLRTQTTAEMFYRFHVTPNFAITPDVQAIFDPSLNPAKNTLWVFGLRARVSF